MWAKFVPHRHTEEQKKRRITGDESWVCQYKPQKKLQSMKWSSKWSPRPKMFRLRKSRLKTKLITSFDKQSVIYKEFLPEGRQTIVLSTLRLSGGEASILSRGQLVLFARQCPIRFAMVVKTSLPKHRAVDISHPRQSPVLALVDFLSFLRWKGPSK